MLVRVYLKTPDAVDRALDEAGLSDETRENAEKVLKKWFEYGECVTIEVDLEKGTATVCEA